MVKTNRQTKIRQQVRTGLNRAIGTFEPEAVTLNTVKVPVSEHIDKNDIFVSLERPPRYAKSDNQYTGTPQMKLSITQSVGIVYTFRRLLVWIWLIISYLTVTMLDTIRKRSTPQQKGKRLRETIERGGGTLIKFGQQASIRLDLLSYPICLELSKMLDEVPPFQSKIAIQIIERNLGKPLETVFSAIDLDPIGSGSIAVVYQAILRDSGEKVAVKVRRPNIDALFAADFRVLDWILGLLEYLSVFRKNYTENVRKEFKTALSFELDFRREARCQHIFRKNAKKVKGAFFSAPKIHFDYSTDEIIVQELVDGFWLTDILAGVEQSDPVLLEQLRIHNIDPEIVAQHILYISYWGLYENLIFHADPHPANILVKDNNQIVMIDFGACGSFDKARRNIYRQFFTSHLREDSWGMVQAALALIEPLPEVDINSLARELQSELNENIIVFKSEQGEWYERTSARVWLGFLGLVRDYSIPVPMDLLLFARCSLLYDSLAARLKPDINFFEEFEDYAKQVGKKARKSAQKAIRKRLDKGLLGSDYTNIGRVLATTDLLLFRVERLLSSPYDFAATTYVIEKWIDVLIQGVKAFIELFIVLFIWLLLQVAYLVLMTDTSLQSINLEVMAFDILKNGWFYFIASLIVLRHIRQIIFRLRDKIPSRR